MAKKLTKDEPKTEEQVNEPVVDETTETQVDEAPTENIVTTENEYADEEEQDYQDRRELTAGDRAKIVKEFNGPEASVSAIAAHYDITPQEVFAIVDEHNKVKAEE